LLLVVRLLPCQGDPALILTLPLAGNFQALIQTLTLILILVLAPTLALTVTLVLAQSQAWILHCFCEPALQLLSEKCENGHSGLPLL
jgi:hypothetical protein